jgi:hypothetical protein
MLKIYSKAENLPKPVVTSHNEVFFRRNFRFADLSPLDFDVIENIDNALIYKDDTFKTPFGLTQIKNLSTGCKTVLNAIHNPDKVFNFAECGGNALSELVRVCTLMDCDISIYLPRYRSIEPLDAPITLDDVTITTSDEFYEAWHGGEEND